jgi:hypothetical protein
MRNHYRNQLVIGVILLMSLGCNILVATAQENMALEFTVQEYALPPLAPNSIVHVVDWSPDGKHLAIGSNATIWLYAADTLEPIAQLEGHTAGKQLGGELQR